MRDSRRLIYVSGAPGSGKTGLAVPLAAEPGYPLLAKDRIKETLHDAFGAPDSDLAELPSGRGPNACRRSGRSRLGRVAA